MVSGAEPPAIGAEPTMTSPDITYVLIRAADWGEAPWLPAIASYERQMLDPDFRFVRASLEDKERFHSESPISQVFARTCLRAVDRVPGSDSRVSYS
jgi:hypothetical protein